jgi:Family of unknown function (DUF6308)
MISVVIRVPARVRYGSDRWRAPSNPRRAQSVEPLLTESRFRATTDSPAGQLREKLRFGRDNVGPTFTRELLDAPTAQLLPIWDSFVEQATGLKDYWRKFQSALTADDRRTGALAATRRNASYAAAPVLTVPTTLNNPWAIIRLRRLTRKWPLVLLQRRQMFRRAREHPAASR